MGKIGTKQLIDEFFDQKKTKSTAEAQKRVVDKPVLYEYEKSIGKELIDMNVDEIFALVNRMLNFRNGSEIPFLVSHYSYSSLLTIFRDIFDYYSLNYEMIYNPLHDPRMRGYTALKQLAQGKERFTWGYVSSILDKLKDNIGRDRTEYIELILQMFRCGFETYDEIILLHEDMIEHQTKTVAMNNRTIHLNDRCYDLLVKFHNSTAITGWRNFDLISWHNSYVKFMCTDNSATVFDNRPIEQVKNYLQRLLTAHINQNFQTQIQTRTLYFLGFYEYIVNVYGVEEVDAIINGEKNDKRAVKIMECAKEYGIDLPFAKLKIYLCPFVDHNY